MTQTNCLKVLCTLPPHIFLSQVYNASNKIQLVYKLNAIVAFSGAHYVVFLRQQIS